MKPKTSVMFLVKLLLKIDVREMMISKVFFGVNFDTKKNVKMSKKKKDFFIIQEFPKTSKITINFNLSIVLENN